MKTVYVISSLVLFVFASCASGGDKQPVVEEEHAVHHPDSTPTDNTAVADSVDGNANVGMGGGD